jgi:hypothetical protein
MSQHERDMYGHESVCVLLITCECVLLAEYAECQLYISHVFMIVYSITATCT